MEILLACFGMLFLLGSPLVNGQCLNFVATYHPTLRTQSYNSTWMLIPVPKTAAQKALDSNYGRDVVLLAAVPICDKSLFPHGFPKDKHPVLVNAGLSDDIRMSVLQIDGPLLSGQVYIPYTRRPKSKLGTVLNAQLNGYISGPNGNSAGPLVPSVVSTLIEGFPSRLGHFTPTANAYQLDSDNIYSNKVAWSILPNPITGPGLYLEAFDMSFTKAKMRRTTPKLFKAMLNQPAILSGPFLATNTCQRNQYYFNNATSVMMPRIGNVTMGPAGDSKFPQLKGVLQAASPDGSGNYRKLEGFSACAQNIGYNPEDCDVASANVDPTSL